METQSLPLKPERMAQLDVYAQRHGKDAATALDEVLADYLAAEQEAYDDTVKAVIKAYEEVKASHSIPADEVLEELRIKHGFPH